MSGRSAYVRKKITETKSSSDKNPGHPSTADLKHPDVSGSHSFDYGEGYVENYMSPPGTGYGANGVRFLKFSESPHPDLSHKIPISTTGTWSSGSQSGGSDGGRRDTGAFQQQQQHQQQQPVPMDSFAYARARKPIIHTEDVSGIERSGFRSAIDKRSDDVRRGISKAFGFGRRSKKQADGEPRTHSSAGMSIATEYGAHESDDMPPMPPLTPSQLASWESHDVAHPPSSESRGQPLVPPPTPPSTIKRWIGAGRPVQNGTRLRKDPELWDPNGDVLVYMAPHGQTPQPQPLFRLSSHIIEATDSRFLIQLMRQGATHGHVPIPPSPDTPSGSAPQNFGSHSESWHMGRGHHGDGMDDAEGNDQIAYEMYFPAPSELSKSEAHRHNITTRNVLALLYHASLVGVTLHQALSDLYSRLETYMPPDVDNIGIILNYLSARAIDDCRNDPETAISLLAWSESQTIRWEEGWREAFLHSVGMYPRLHDCADYRLVTPISRALLERASLETQLRVQAAEERLADFSYGDIWPQGGLIANSHAKAASDRLRKFFISHYSSYYGEWPPPPSATDDHSGDGEDIWLTRNVAQKLQKDFGALYDYLVNRDITWDESETRSSRKWEMVSESGNKAFDADTVDLPMTDLLIEWDNRSKFPHIPHPYPLVPDSFPPTNAPVGLRDRAKRDKHKGTEDRAVERRIHLAYTEATNIYILGSDFQQSGLIDSFVKFEKSDHIGMLDPMVGRRGRWVLIYGILQTLATISVDAPYVRYKKDVKYHLCPRLKGVRLPPWRGVANISTEPAHELSHCWTTAQTWNDSSDQEAADELSPITMMMSAQGHQFPNPPPSVARSSTSGWQASMPPSGRSSALGTSSAVSVMSDDARSFRTVATSIYRAPSHDRTRNSKSAATPASPTSAEGEAVRPRAWSHRSRSISAARSAAEVAAMSVKPLPPLADHVTANAPSGGGFLDLEESPPPVSRKKTNSRSVTPRERRVDAAGTPPVIRDFDELHVDDNEIP
ncbi:hypothetical protein PFICI_15131 [Pestalotiopsis fici W106-1]|uniref:DUF8004 domain-containing protein n=1 Tax=Pestalotiopsis fici (strain W106-1 / CGMCC3.15140) TaxID=1229662 RepID=W3WK44_PESFW|nr:uncharacterized protein PFICI_15131 [Pestalotiopsis fici W106-1]ETS73186.1 hypothetical protein PFICI_15131 [Pestalotiopsis fici W106-1]